uniref:Uncharacterized protein n=1 Tax=Rhodosorus marinus TaxID=101924 RepID=A0A7S3E907_9RHOD|mmetsp:Transcript_18536/g.74500  ORF Transcript_18536/g.74500 Transcript_18536/m.74500 type:complete len:142 (+) Transcript_18536:295-720(+)
MILLYSQVSLRFSTGKPDRTREHTFHNEEPEKFKALRKREEKFQAKKCTSVRHEDDMPVAYLRGTQEFDGLSLFVEKQSVIVPRKATETLVHACMNALRGNSVAHSTMSRRGIYSLLMSIALRSLAATCTRRCCGRPPTNT